jgi:hypothetical protein
VNDENEIAEICATIRYAVMTYRPRKPPKKKVSEETDEEKKPDDGSETA